MPIGGEKSCIVMTGLVASPTPLANPMEVSTTEIPKQLVTKPLKVNDKRVVVNFWVHNSLVKTTTPPPGGGGEKKYKNSPQAKRSTAIW